MLGAVSAIVGVAGAVLLPYLRGYITDVQMENLHTPRYKYESKFLIHEFVESAEFNQLAAEWVRDHSEDNLRGDLANKMGVDPDEVHIELGRMYNRQKLWSFNQESDQPQNDTTQ